MTAIRAVLFDLDRTLVDLEAATVAAIEAHLLALGQPGGPAEYARWKGYEEEFVGRFVAGELGLYEQRRARARAMARAPQLTDAEADAWFGDYHRWLVANQRAFEDTVPALAALARYDGLKVGIVTNMHTEYQLGKLANVGLPPERFDCVLGLDLLPEAKPGAGAFLTGCEALGVEPAEAMFVGDEPYIDAAGARDAGLRAVWLDRTGRAGRLDPAGLAELAGIEIVTGLAELTALL